MLLDGLATAPSRHCATVPDVVRTSARWRHVEGIRHAGIAAIEPLRILADLSASVPTELLESIESLIAARWKPRAAERHRPAKCPFSDRGVRGGQTGRQEVPRRLHGCEKTAVEARIAQLDRAVARIVIETHVEILAWMTVAVWRFSDIVICGCHASSSVRHRRRLGVKPRGGRRAVCHDTVGLPRDVTARRQAVLTLGIEIVVMSPGCCSWESSPRRSRQYSACSRGRAGAAAPGRGRSPPDCPRILGMR